MTQGPKLLTSQRLLMSQRLLTSQRLRRAARGPDWLRMWMREGSLPLHSATGREEVWLPTSRCSRELRCTHMPRRVEWGGREDREKEKGKGRHKCNSHRRYRPKPRCCMYPRHRRRLRQKPLPLLLLSLLRRLVHRHRQSQKDRLHPRLNLLVPCLPHHDRKQQRHPHQQ